MMLVSRQTIILVLLVILSMTVDMVNIVQQRKVVMLSCQILCVLVQRK